MKLLHQIAPVLTDAYAGTRTPTQFLLILYSIYWSDDGRWIAGGCVRRRRLPTDEKSIIVATLGYDLLIHLINTATNNNTSDKKDYQRSHFVESTRNGFYEYENYA